MSQFQGKVLMLGYGAVARCTLPLVIKLLDLPPAKLTVVDFEDYADLLKPWTAQGTRFVQERISPENLGAVLEQYVGPGDLVLDLAWNIDACEIIDWCHRHGVLYVNTSTEVWDPYAGAELRHPTESTLYFRHMKLRRLRDGWDEKGPTAVIEHGANPGLIAHWTKQGLIDVAESLLVERRVTGAKAETLRHLVDSRQFNHLARALGVKVIHCSERDTQISDRPKLVDEFVNTWSIEGLREEGTTTSEMGWGTHEKKLPPLAYEHSDGPRNQICLARMGINTWVRSWVPHYTIQGMVIRHGEAFTISDFLTVWEEGKAVYRPTVHYAYCPCDAAIASLQELCGNDYRLQSHLRIMNDEIVSGADILGALIMGHPYNSWWTGSDLSIAESRQIVPGQNATPLQVAISVVSAAAWMIEHPAEGLCTSEKLPHDFILAKAQPYLGTPLSVCSDWTPLKHRHDFFPGQGFRRWDLRDPWQFKNFLITDGQ
jgi:homospermidine synthase